MRTYTYISGKKSFTFDDIAGIRKSTIASNQLSKWSYLALCYDPNEKRIFTREISSRNGTVEFNDGSVHFFTLAGSVTQFTMAGIVYNHADYLGISHFVHYSNN